jgi:hypothetical protein
MGAAQLAYRDLLQSNVYSGRHCSMGALQVVLGALQAVFSVKVRFNSSRAASGTIEFRAGFPD